MSYINIKCVFCGETTMLKTIKFTLKTLQKCINILEYRRSKPILRKSRKIYDNLEISIESSLNEVYHAQCYKLFTAIKIPRDVHYLQQQSVDNASEISGNSFESHAPVSGDECFESHIPVSGECSKSHATVDSTYTEAACIWTEDKMPGYCSAPGCSNSHSKGFSMRRFPKDPKKRQLWTQQMNCGGWIPNDNTCLCEVHFEPNMWEKERVDGTRKLKFCAIPTVFMADPTLKKANDFNPTKIATLTEIKFLMDSCPNLMFNEKRPDSKIYPEDTNYPLKAIEEFKIENNEIKSEIEIKEEILDFHEDEQDLMITPENLHETYFPKRRKRRFISENTKSEILRQRCYREKLKLIQFKLKSKKILHNLTAKKIKLEIAKLQNNC